MEDQHFISGKHSNPSVFNNSQDSDIILKCGTECFYAHRAILRLWSPFFARSLNSEFPVAKSAVFEIDTEGQGNEPFCALLKHMYGMPFGEHPENYEYQDSPSFIEHCIRVYMAADKYDVPSVRLAALASVKDDLTCCDPPCTETDIDDYGDYRCHHTAEWIGHICGPEAPQLADGAMRNALFDWVNSNFDLLSEDHNFAVKIQNGSLLDTELNAKLLFTLGAKVRRVNKKNEAMGVRR